MMNFVNMFGESVDPNKHQLKKKSKVKEFVPFHSGWVVKGASPDTYAKKMSERNHLIDSIKKLNADYRNKVKRVVPEPLPPFYEWAKTNKKQKASAKPFSNYKNALECKQLAEKSGWMNVEITELTKGDVSQLKGLL